jgi:hypothetical protein
MKLRKSVRCVDSSEMRKEHDCMAFYTSESTFQSCHHVGSSDKTNNFEMLLKRDKKEAIHLQFNDLFMIRYVLLLTDVLCSVFRS